VVQLDQPGGRTYKEAGPEASVQLRNLTVVERASEQLMDECFRFGVGQVPAGTYTSSNLTPAMPTSAQSATAEWLDINRKRAVRWQSSKDSWLVLGMCRPRACQVPGNPVAKIGIKKFRSLNQAFVAAACPVRALDHRILQ